MAEWTVPLDDALIEALASDFRNGPLMDDGSRLLEEQLVAWLDALKIEIFSREHPPPAFSSLLPGRN